MKIPAPQIRKARIEIIPMIDTIFFLLVFFMITSLSMVKMKAMSLALPKNSPSRAATGGGSSRSHTVIFTVTDAGGYYLGHAPIAPETLKQSLQARVNADPQSVVVLNLAKSQTTQSLIQIMDLLNGITTPDGQHIHALLATEPIDQDGRALPPATTKKDSTHVP